jgi:hypothetical protein
VGTDLRSGRESLADALRQSEQGGAEGGPAFEWDIAVDVGDLSGGQDTPKDPEGQEVVRQFAALTRHPREAVCNVCGKSLIEARWGTTFLNVAPQGWHAKAERAVALSKPFRWSV